MANKVKIPCPKCDAKGVIPQYFYNRKGICFMCWGAKYVTVKVPVGKNLEDYKKELRTKNKPDFKKNPPKVEMPHKDEIKNPSYFPASNSKIEPKAEVKKEEPKKEEGLSDEAKNKIREKIRRNFESEDDIEYLEYLIRDREKTANNETYSKNMRDKAAIEVDELKKIMAEKQAVRDAADDGDSAIRKAAAEQIKNLSVEQLQAAFKNIKAKLVDNPNPARIAVITGETIRDRLIEVTDGPKPTPGFKKLPTDGEFSKEFTRKLHWNRFYEPFYEERKGDKAALRELKEHIERFGPVEYKVSILNSVETDIAALDIRQWYELKREAGIDKHGAKAANWKKALELMDSDKYKDNKEAQSKSTRAAVENQIIELTKHEEYVAYMDKYFPLDEGSPFRAYDMYTKEQADEALKELDSVSDATLREKVKAFAKGILEYRRKNAGRDELVAKVDAMNKERKDKRREITENIKFKDTELGRKVKAMVDKGVNSPEDAEAIGKVVAERFEENIAELGGIDYKELATKYRAYRDMAKKMDEIDDIIDKSYKKRHDGRASFESREKAIKQHKEATRAKQDLEAKLKEARYEVAEYDDKIKAIKPEAYVKTMSEIREMGGHMNFTDESQKASPEVYRRFQEETAGKFPKEWIEASNLLPMQLAPVPRDGRGYHRGEKESFVSRDNATGEYVVTTPIGELALDAEKDKWSGRESVYHHELQHRMEAINPKLNKLMREMYVKKVSNAKGKAKKAKWLGSGYKKLETYRETADGKGPWMSKYMGKHYGNKFDTSNPADTDGWEIGTMASEMIIFDKLPITGRRIEFFQEDIYHFMLGVYASV